MSRTGHGTAAPAAAPTPAVGSAIMVSTFAMRPGSRFDTHAHQVVQLAWARSGVLVVTTGTGDWILPPTRALWIPAGVRHQTAASGSTTMRTLFFDPGPDPGPDPDPGPESGPGGWSSPQPVAVGPLVAELIDHLADPALEPGRRARAQAVLLDNLEPVAPTTITAPMPTDSRALDVARALVDNPADPRTLDQWGRHVGASARTLARAFAEDTGVPFARWRTTVRLRAALPHLADGESVTRVAGRVGYATPSAFVAAFRRETGLTPGGYFRYAGTQTSEL
jgi:AraC-like DNA-binding protein/quercetin dioxygenase-like cupin family protein